MGAITSILTIVGAFVLLGASATNLLGDVGKSISCGFCQDGVSSVVADVGSVVTRGQNEVNLGVEGIKELRNQTSLGAATKQGLSEMYKQKIWFGSFLTLLYIIITFAILTAFVDLAGGIPSPVINGVAAILLVGVIHMAFMGFSEPFYGGWINLWGNFWVMSKDVAEAIIPITMS